MGALFKLEHANIMAYITSRSAGAPRVRRTELREFLEAFAYRARDYLIPERGFEPWPEEISEIAGRALSALPGTEDRTRDETAFPSEVEAALGELRSEFSQYQLYALAVGNDARLREIAHELASMPLYGQLLVLIPLYYRAERNFEVLDPVPVFSHALHAAPDWPGFLFWTPTGVSAFAPVSGAMELAQKLLDARQHPRRHRHFPWRDGVPADFDAVLRAWTPRSSSRRLLHLSDLHFGTKHALQNQALLEAELRTVIRSVDRVVITGDLFDSPKASYATLFTNFRNSLTHLADGREPISIPGNHDQRIWGNVGRNFEEIASLSTKKVVVDEQAHMIFVCFNSSERGSFARGKIPKAQFRYLGGEYQTLLSARPELNQYLPIVLVHHHPFSFETKPETWVQRTLATFGLREESFLAMSNADELHQWCADWSIRTILHGHKHKARYVEREVACSDGKTIRLTAIGCGSSLGAEDTAVAYNVLEWDPGTQRWVASIFQSTNGGAFRESVAAVSGV